MTPLPRPIRAAAVLGVLLATSAFTVQKAPTGLLHDHPDAPMWQTLKAGAKFTVDAKKGLYLAAFDANLRAQADKPFTVEGYMLPLEAAPESRHFVVTRRNSTCPFCPPNEIGEAVEVFARAPVRFTDAQIKVSGRLELISSSAQGLFFQLEDAEAS